MSSVTPVAGSQRSAESDHRWLILVIVAVAQLMVVLDATVVNIALPSAQHALGFPNSDRQWVVTAYALAFEPAAVGGRRRLFSRKRVFITGLVGFAFSSALGGAATSFGCWWLPGLQAHRAIRPAAWAPWSAPSATARGACVSVRAGGGSSAALDLLGAGVSSVLRCDAGALFTAAGGAVGWLGRTAVRCSSRLVLAADWRGAADAARWSAVSADAFAFAESSSAAAAAVLAALLSSADGRVSASFLSCVRLAVLRLLPCRLPAG